MWTQATRPLYARKGLRYPSDLTDDEWTLVAPLIPPAKRGGRKRKVDVREVLNGIFYVAATGCQWRALPKDLARIHEVLVAEMRTRAGRDRGPSLGIIDSQSVKGAEKGGRASIRRAMTRRRRSGARSVTSSSTRKA